jgi:VanZ family protein
MARHRISASPLAWLYAGLIVYASLYPFSHWEVPGSPLLAFLRWEWSPWWTWFDLVANLLGYAPLGALIFGALVRRGVGGAGSVALAVLVGSGLSIGMEFAQNFLPQRVPSSVDLGLNSLGTVLGVAAGLLVHLMGGVERWQAARDRWFIARSAGGIALLLLWPFGLLAPLPVPFGTGQVLAHVYEGLANLLVGTPISTWVDDWFDAPLQITPLASGTEFLLIALGLLSPCLLAFSVAQPGWRRLPLALGLGAMGGLATTLSVVLNFGPQHVLAWSTPQALAALAFGLSLAALLSMAPQRASVGMGLVALAALVTLVARAPADPYYAETLQAWEQGRFVRFHGAARWVGWLWPYAAIIYLLVRLGAPNEPPKISG